MKEKKHAYKYLLLLHVFIGWYMGLHAQCPANIGFESGSFVNWTCDSSTVYSLKKYFANPGAGPSVLGHKLIQNDGFGRKDPYGGFPVNCPNGSGYSIQLGNIEPGGAEGVSYTLTVPADKNVYSIIYNYALVLQDPNHSAALQPKFTARVYDVDADQYIDCSSFEFAANSSLPGFIKSASRLQDADIYYKTWTPVTIKLDGYAGKKVRIEFIVKDCGEGGHFGYAYLDFNEDCSSSVKGGVVCEGANSAAFTAPYGFKEYRWYNSDFSKLLGSGNTLKLSPVPPLNTMLAIEIIPYPGSGCVDTLYTIIGKAPVSIILAVQDSIGICFPSTVDLTAGGIVAGSSTGLQFSYYTDSTLSGYIPLPQAIDKPGVYYIKAVNSVGCIDARPIRVVTDSMPVVTVTDPAVSYYPNKTDITNPALITTHSPGLTYTYWKDAAARISLPDPKTVEIAGVYYIQASTHLGCSVINPVNVMIQVAPPPNIFTPNNDGINDVWEIPGLKPYAQCTVDIYDRYGRIVFHSKGYSTPWNGYINGKPLPVATYYYVIRTSEQFSAMSGSVTLIR